MEFEWDEAKSDLCFVERGFDFAYAVRVFLDPDRLIERDDRVDYGEPAIALWGKWMGGCLSFCTRLVRGAFASSRRARPINERCDAMKRVRATLFP